MRDIMIATGYYDTQWRRFEAGGSINLQSLMKVAMALDVSLAELFDGLGEWPKRSVSEIEGQVAFNAGKSHLKANAGQPENQDLALSKGLRAAKKTHTAKRSSAVPLSVSAIPDSARPKRKAGK